MKNDAQSATDPLGLGVSSYRGMASARQSQVSASGLGARSSSSPRAPESDAAARERAASADRNGVDILSFGTIASGLVLGAMLPGPAEAYGAAHAHRTPADDGRDHGSDHAPVTPPAAPIPGDHGQTASAAPAAGVASQSEIPHAAERPDTAMDAAGGRDMQLASLAERGSTGVPPGGLDDPGAAATGIATHAGQLNDAIQSFAPHPVGSSSPPSPAIPLEMPEIPPSGPPGIVSAAVPISFGDPSSAIDRTLVDAAVGGGINTAELALSRAVPDLPGLPSLPVSTDAIDTLAGGLTSNLPLADAASGIGAAASSVLGAVDGAGAELGSSLRPAVSDLPAVGSVLVNEADGILQPVVDTVSRASDDLGGLLGQGATALESSSSGPGPLGGVLAEEHTGAALEGVHTLASGIVGAVIERDGGTEQTALPSVAGAVAEDVVEASGVGSSEGPATPVLDGLTGSAPESGLGGHAVQALQGVGSSVLGDARGEGNGSPSQGGEPGAVVGRLTDAVAPTSHAGEARPGPDPVALREAVGSEAGGSATDLVDAGGKVGSVVGSALTSAVDLGDPHTSSSPRTDRDHADSGHATNPSAAATHQDIGHAGASSVTHAAADVIQAPAVHVGFAGQSYVDTVDSHDHGLASANGLLHGLV